MIPVNKLPSPESVIELIPQGVSLDALREHGIVPVRKDGDILVVALSDMAVFAEAQLVASRAGLACEAEIHDAADIRDLIRALYDIKSGVAQETLNDIEEVNDLSELARQEVMSDTVDAPVIKLVNGIMVESIKERATDIHIEPYEDRMTVRYRTDGVLRDMYTLSKGHQAPVTSRIKVMANLDIAERFIPQDGRIGISLGDRMVDIRVSTLPTQHGERIVMRMLDKARGLLTLEELGIQPYRYGSDRTPHSWAGVPLFNADARAIGVIAIQDTRPYQYDQQTIEFLYQVASHLSLGVQKVALFAAEKTARRTADTLREVARVLNTSLDPDDHEHPGLWGGLPQHPPGAADAHPLCLLLQRPGHPCLSGC